MKYNFKKFKGKNIKQESRITLTKSYQVGFPTKFYKDNRIRDYRYIELFWDVKNKAIGIHFTNEKEEESCFSIIHSENYGGIAVIRSFLKTNNINPKIYRGRYEWEKENLKNVGGIFIIKLRKK